MSSSAKIPLLSVDQSESVQQTASQNIESQAMYSNTFPRDTDYNNTFSKSVRIMNEGIARNIYNK